MKKLWIAILALGLITTALTGCLMSKPEAVEAPASATTPGPTGGRPAGEIKAYIPCGMIVPLRAVIDQFQSGYPAVRVVGVYDNSGVLVDRILKKHEKADVVVSPGSTEMGHLERAGLLDSASQQAVGSFDLVVITARAGKLEMKWPADLKKCRTIACPDPQVSSIGTAGQEALTKLGLWAELKPKMVFTTHAIEAYTMAASGKAEACIAYRNCPLETNPEKLSKSKVAIAFAFPTDTYTRQQCLVAPLKASANLSAARAFVLYFASPEGRKLLAANGMTGCLDDQSARPRASSRGAEKAKVKVVAFYPGNERHTPIKKMIEALPAKYGGQVSAEFVDFTTDEGLKRRTAAGLTCGGILINGQQTWTYQKDGKKVEVTFQKAEGGEWTEADLNAVIKMLLKK